MKLLSLVLLVCAAAIGLQDPPPDPPRPSVSVELAGRVSTAAELKNALLTPGAYQVQAGTYVGDFYAGVAGVSLRCDDGVIFAPASTTSTAWTVRASNFALTGSWRINMGVNVGMEIGDNAATTQAQQPDTVLIDGGMIVAPAGGALRGVAIHGSHVVFTHNRVEGVYRVGQETQAVWVNNTNGPITITDNYLEAAGENFMTGGDHVHIPNAVPSDIYFARNMVIKRAEWRTQSPSPAVKNLFELKNARRVLIEDNTFDGNWANNQNGTAILFTPRNQYGDTPWAIVDDVVFRHNIVRNSYQAGVFSISILGNDTLHPSLQTTRMTFQGNLFQDQQGGIIVYNGVTEQLMIDHNTWPAIKSEVLSFGDVDVKSVVVMTNNAAQQGFYGVIASGVGSGIPALNAACSAYTITGNVFGRNQTNLVTWPAGNTVIPSPGIVFSGPTDWKITGAQAGADAGWPGPVVP